MNELSPWDDDPLDSAAQSTPTDSGPMPWDADPIEPRRNASPGRRMVRPIEGFDAPEEYGPEQPPRYEDMSVPARARAQLTAGLHGMDASTSMPALSATSRILQQMDRIDAGGALDPNDPESGPVQAYRMSDPATRQRTRGVFEQQLGRSITHIINAQARQQAQPRNPRAEEITRAGNEGRWGDAWRIFRDDPAGIIQQFTVESIPASAAMMVPGVGAAAAGAGRVGTGIAAYLGSAGTEFGSQQLEALNDALQRAGVDANDPAAMQAWVRANPDALREMVNAAARGMNGPAIFDALTLGFGRGIVPGRGVLRNTGRVGANFAAESAGEPAGAALGQVLAEGEVSKPGDLIGEALGGLGQVGPTTAAGTLQEMREARAAGALPVQPPAPQTAPVPAPQTPAAGPTTPAPAAPPAAPPVSAAVPPPPPPVAPAASSPAVAAPAGAAAPPIQAPAPGAAAVPPAAPAEAAAGVAHPPPAPAAPSPQPPVANTGRADLEAMLDDPRSAAQIEQDRATERAAGISALEQGLPQGWSVVDEDGAVSVLDPNGEWAFQWEAPPADPTQTLAEARQMHDEGLRTGLYGEAVREGDGTRAAPVQAQNPGDVDAAAQNAAPPTPAQAQAGNYAKGHLRLHGLDLAIETPRGGTRSGVGADGRPWSVQMPAHYGEVKRTEGADGDPVDVYLGPQAEDASAPVFVVDQIDPDTGRFDEHKVMLGFSSDAEAVAAYNAAFNDDSGPRRRGAITRMSLDEFKAWLHSAQRGPVARESIKAGIQIRRAEKAKQRDAAKAAKAPAPAPEPEEDPAGSVEMVEGVAEANGLNLSQAEIRQAAALVDQGMSPKAAILQVTDAAAIEAEGEAAAQADEGSPWREVAFAPREQQEQPDMLGGRPRGRDEMDVEGMEALTMDGLEDRETEDDGPAEAQGSVPNSMSFANMTPAEAMANFRTQDPSEQADTIAEIEDELRRMRGVPAMRYRRLLVQMKEEVEQRDTRAEGQAGEADAGAGGAPAQADGEGAAGTPPPRDEPRTGGADTGAAALDDLDALFDEVLTEEFGQQPPPVAPTRDAVQEQRFRGATAEGRARELARLRAVAEQQRKDLGPAGALDTEEAIARMEAAQAADQKAAAERPTGQVAASAAKNTARGMADIALALESILLPKGGKVSSNPLFDPEQYQRVLPLMREAVAHFREAWADVKELMRRVVRALTDAIPAERRRQFAEALRPYITRFARDVQSGSVQIEEAQADGLEGGSEGDAAAGEPQPAGGPAGEGDAGADAVGTGSGGGRPVRRDGGAAAEGASAGEREPDGPAADGSAGDQRGEAAGDRDADSPAGAAGGDAVAAAVQAATPEQTGKNYVITDADEIGAGSERQKARDNIEAIRTLKTLEAEGRKATTEEQAVLVKYVGWGGLKQVFKRHGAAQWAEQIGKDLRELLTAEEYDLAEGSVLNAHYTSPEVIRGMWDAVRHLGFQGGRVLEPSAGVGHFLGLAPRDLPGGLRWTAGELDSITGRILGQLYPEAAVNVGPFERARLPDGFYDLAISNVPFGDYPANDPSPRYERARRAIHDYFFARALDLVRPGGVVAFITSRYTLDKISDASRRLYAEKGVFLGAIRLPDTAFKGNAGTEVVTDVIFLRRLLPGEAPTTDADWLRTAQIQTPEGPTTINAWFAARPEMMLGQMRLTGTMYSRGEPTLKPREGEKLTDAFAAAIGNLPPDGFRSAPPSAPQPAGADLEAAVGERAGAYGLDDKGGVYAVVDGRRQPVTGREAGLARSYIGIRDALRALIRAEQKGEADATVDPLRKALNTAYDAFVKAYGPLNAVKVRKSPNGKSYRALVNLRPLASDPDIWRVAAIEDYDADKDTASKRAVFRERIIAAANRASEANTPADAIALSLDTLGRFDLAFAAQTLGKTEAEAIEAFGDMIYRNPEGQAWETAVEYLSGDVRKKLAQAEAAARLDDAYQRNVEALRPKIPPTLIASPDPLANEIAAPFGANWIPEKVYRTFLDHLAGREMSEKIRVRWAKAAAAWSIEVGGINGFRYPALKRFETDRVRFDFMLRQTMNNVAIKVYDEFREPDGGTTRVLNEKETKKALTVQAQIRTEFENWVYLDDKRRDEMAALYNEKYNNLAPRDWRSQADILSFPGIATRIVRGDKTLPFQLRPHQKAAIWRVVAAGNTLLGHAVGAGKTFTMIGAGMEMKRLGLARKPLYVVPNHMLGQFRREFYELYPGADLMVATKDDMSRRGRQGFVGRVAASNPDAIIMTHSSFGRLPMRREAYAEFVREELDRTRAALDEAIADEGKRGPTVRLIRKKLKQLEARLAKLLQEDKKDTGATFEETGIDFLFVDEAHEFKNLPISTKMGNVRGLSTGASQKAIDLLVKIYHIEKSRPNRSVVFATGTPVSNTMAEVYTMQRFLQPRVLEEQGIETFDAWASTFGEVVSSLEVSPSGKGFKEATRFARFRNAPELTAIFSTVADVQTAEMLNLPRPSLAGGKATIVAVKPTAWQEAKTAELAGRYENLPPDPSIDNALKIVTEGRKSALDPRLLDEQAGEDSGGKIGAMAERILRIYAEGNGPMRRMEWESWGKRGYHGAEIGVWREVLEKENPGKLQIVFLDLGTPGNKRRSGATTIIDGEAEDVTDAGPVQVEVDESEGEEAAPAPDAEQLAMEQAEAELNAFAPDTGFNVYDALTSMLVRGGIPRSEIAYIHDAKNDAQKEELFNAAREGRVRVLMGSTAKMGVGTNVQRLAIAMHHGDAPWRPSDVEQRDGRILRQGNLNPEVTIFRYVTEGTFDAYMWQTLEAKAKFIGQFLAGAKGKRSVEDVDTPLPDAATVKAIATGDPRILEAANLERDVGVLVAAREQFARTKEQARSVVRQIPQQIAAVTKYRDALKGDAEAFRSAKWTGADGTVFENAEAALAGGTGSRIATDLQAAIVRSAEKSAFVATAVTVDLPITFGAFPVSAEVNAHRWKQMVQIEKAVWGEEIVTRASVQPIVKGKRAYLAGREFEIRFDKDVQTIREGSLNPAQILTRVDGMVRGLDGKVSEIERNLANLEKDLGQAERQLEATFPKEEEYREKMARLRSLQAALTEKKPGAPAEQQDAADEDEDEGGDGPIRINLDEDDGDKEGVGLYANPFDPALFMRLVWQPLRDALGGSTALNAIAAKIGGLHRDALGRIFRDPPLPPNSTIENRAEAQDVTALARWFKTPERMFAKWPALARLVQDGMRAEQRAGVWRKRLTDEYEAIRTELRRAKGDWQKVAEALYLADAEAVDLDSTEAAREFYEEQGLAPAEAKATAALHRLLMKQGRLVDQHRRAMMPVIRARKAEIWRRMERVLNSASVDSKAYQTKYRRRAYLNARIKAGKGDLAAQAAERDSLTAELREIRTNDPEIRAAYDALREEYDGLEARLADTSIRNRIKGYFPHKFYGSWRLYRIEKDADGKDQRVEITSDQGFYDSRGEAIAAARAYAAEHPGARLHIEPRKVSFPEALAGTPVTDANFRRISEGLAEEASLSPDEVLVVLKGKLRRRSRRRVLAAAMKRAGAEGFAGAKEGTEAEMADRVLRTHINQIVRYVTMDRLKAQYVNTTERMGLSPGRLNSIQREGRLQLFNALEAWWRDVNGAKQGFEQVLDGALQRLGLPGSTLAAAVSGAAVGGLVSPYIAPVLAGYAGYRMYRAMTKGGEFPTRAVIGGIVGDMAHLKLGMLVNIGSALVNLTQTMVNTFPLLGAKWTAEGAKRAAEAMWSMSRNRDNSGRMSEDAHILRRLDVVTDQRYTEENEIVRPALGALRRLSMFWFERAERVNRATAALGAYHRALDRGATPGTAFEEARKLMTRTQFHQGAANRPELLRQQWARIPTQFQNFMYQQIAFAFGLRGKAEISRFLISLMLVAGFLGLPGLQILDWLLGLVLDTPPLLMARLWAIDKAAGSSEAMTAAQVLLRGLPALAGVDISGRVGMGKGFGPERLSDLAGPTIGSLIRLAELTRREAPILEQLGAVSPAANQAREVAGLVEGGVRTSGMRRGYVEDQPTTGERVRALTGLRPLARSIETDVREGQREATEDRRRAVDRYIARIVQAVQDDQPERIADVRREAAQAGVTLTQRQIVAAVRDSQRTRAERDIRRAPRDIRPDVANRQRAVEEFRGTGP